MKTKCYSVRLASLVSISDKAYKATAFDGSTAIIPKSQEFGQDYEVQKSEAYWISAWILEKKDLQYSTKKEAWFDENDLKLIIDSNEWNKEDVIVEFFNQHTDLVIDWSKFNGDYEELIRQYFNFSDIDVTMFYL